MHKVRRSGWRCHDLSRWLVTRGAVLALVMELCALALAAACGGLRPDTVYLWACAGYLQDSGFITLTTALAGGLLLEDLLRRRED